jgi:hypothetical protein
MTTQVTVVANAEQSEREKKLAHLKDVLSLAKRDVDYYYAFRAQLELDGLTEFSSDDFRGYKLDRWMPENKRRRLIGVLFAKWKFHRFLRVVSRKKSCLPKNHDRGINVYVWTETEIPMLETS